MPRLTFLAIAVVAVLGLAACTEQEPDITLEDQIPAAEREDDAAADDNGEPADDAGDAEESITVEAGDLFFEGIPDTLPAGTIAIELVNVGNLPHDVTIEELGDRVVVDVGGGETDTGTVTLDPGEYTFYCSVPGHRAQMEETVTVE